MQDVTIPDGTNIAYGAKFTKTWQFQNTGTCPWINYSIAFVSGDRMQAPDSARITDTAPKKNVNVSVDLVAPGSDGVYTGVFELRNAAGKPLPIGIEKTFWVKITVGNATLPTLPAHPAARKLRSHDQRHSDLAEAAGELYVCDEWIVSERGRAVDQPGADRRRLARAVA